MAYAAAVTFKTRRQKNGKDVVIVQIVETGAAATDTWSTAIIPAGVIPRSGTLYYQAQLVSGTAATIQPRIGKVTGWADSTVDQIVGPPTAAAYLNQVAIHYSFGPAQTVTIFGRSTVNAGADNAITTILTLQEE